MATINESSDNPTPTSHTQRRRAPTANRSEMDSGNQTSFVASMLSDDPAPTSYGQQQRAPIADRSLVDMGTQTSPAHPELYVVSYDAQKWYHGDITDTITRLDGKPIHIGPAESAGDRRLFGVLDVHASLDAAGTEGISWLYDQLKAVDPDVALPIPVQDHSRCGQVSWKKSRWGRSADGSLVYAISDTFRGVQLVVLVTRCACDESEDEGGEEGQEENAAGEEKDGGEVETTGLPSHGGDVRAGNAGKRKREDTEREGEIGGTETGGQDDSGGYGQGRRAKKGKTDEVVVIPAHMSEAVDLLLTVKRGR